MAAGGVEVEEDAPGGLLCVSVKNVEKGDGKGDLHGYLKLKRKPRSSFSLS